FLGLLVVMLGGAKLGAVLARRVGQPAVLGELLAGVVLGTSVLGVVDPNEETVHLLAELGVILLLFEIGLETDLRKLLRVGGASAAVAVVGVALPFSFGYGACRLLGVGGTAAVVAGAALTATSVGITARVLADLGRLHDPEAQVVLGAAVIDDVIGLVILAVVSGVAAGEEVTAGGVLRVAGVAVGFLVAALVVGRWVVPPLVRRADRPGRPRALAAVALLIALGMAWAAAKAGSAPIVGAFAAGLLIAGTEPSHRVQQGMVALGQFFVPLFFVTVGAAVDVRVFDPTNPANGRTLVVFTVLTAVAVATKFAAGYAPVWFRGRKAVIGVGMVPRGEVGLIFAQMGLAAGVFDAGQFSAMTAVVMATTFLAPPLLKALLSRPAGVRGEPRPAAYNSTP
ncbi:MAG TPA: cation:proton antiporter, partial [Gemmataceae bacterium]